MDNNKYLLGKQHMNHKGKCKTVFEARNHISKLT